MRLSEALTILTSYCGSYPGSTANSVRERKWRPNVLAGPAPRFASELMRGYHDKVRKLGNEVHKLGVEELHRLRIRIKKLRYATEFFGSMWPSRRPKYYLSALKDLQQVLGTLHDSTVAEKLLTDLRTAAVAAADFAAGPINYWLANCQRRGRKDAIELWRRFAKQKFFWEST